MKYAYKELDAYASSLYMLSTTHTVKNVSIKAPEYEVVNRDQKFVIVKFISLNQENWIIIKAQSYLILNHYQSFDTLLGDVRKVKFLRKQMIY